MYSCVNHRDVDDRALADALGEVNVGVCCISVSVPSSVCIGVWVAGCRGELSERQCVCVCVCVCLCVCDRQRVSERLWEGLLFFFFPGIY